MDKWMALRIHIYIMHNLVDRLITINELELLKRQYESQPQELNRNPCHPHGQNETFNDSDCEVMLAGFQYRLAF